MTTRPCAPLSLRATLHALENRRTSPSELLEMCLARVSVAQRFGAFTFLDVTAARAAARDLDPARAGPLYGVPVAVKDLVDVRGMPTAAGRSGGPIARDDAPIVARLREAGAIVIGKTRTDELGLGTFTPGGRDPRDQHRSPGGSSGGSSIAVAVGAVALAVATDTAGSARIPAAACGVAGLCASAAGLPAGGTVALSPSFDRLGLIAADGADLRTAWEAITGVTVADQPYRVLLMSASALGSVEPAYVAAAESAARRLSPKIDCVTAPDLASFGPARAVVITADAAMRHRVVDAETEVVRWQLKAGMQHASNEVEAARFRLAELGLRLRNIIGDGVLVTPTIPALPPLWAELTNLNDQLRAIGRLTRLCGPVNSAGLVAVSVPWVDQPGDRPIGVQLVATSEAAVLAAAARLT